MHPITVKIISLGSNIAPLSSSLPLLKQSLVGINWNVLKVDFRFLFNVINRLKTTFFERKF